MKQEKLEEKSRCNLINKINENGEISLSIGHYSILNSELGDNFRPKIAIYGLGSCVSPIIFDKKKKIVGISHILLPTSEKSNQINYPHKYANLSIKNLVEEILKHGGNLKDLNAIITGGANIFKNPECTIGIENVNAVRKELKKLDIKIVKEEIGGYKGRVIIFNGEDFSISIKSDGNNYFKNLLKDDEK